MTLPQDNLKLWGFPTSSSMVPHILLKEIGAEFQFLKVEYAGNFTEEFRKLNPKLRVPVLGMGQEIITELQAIVTAISYMAPDKHVLGATPLETIRAYEWLDWLAGTMHASAFTVWLRPSRFSDDETTFEAIQAKGMAKFKDCIRQVEEALNGPTAIPSGFTAVDAFLYVIYRWAASKEGIDMTPYPKYTALFQAVRQRPMVQEVVEAEGVRLACD